MLSKGVRPQNPAQHLRGSSRRCSGAGQDRGVQAIMPRQETCRDAVCAFEAYPTARPAAIARAMRCPVRVHVGSDCAEPSQACQVGRPATTTRPCVLCVTVASVSKVERKPPRTIQRVATDGFNKWHQSSRAVRVPTFTTKSARNGHTECVASCLLSGVKRKTCALSELFRFGPWLRENVHRPRMRRIVFSIVFS